MRKVWRKAGAGSRLAGWLVPPWEEPGAAGVCAECEWGGPWSLGGGGGPFCWDLNQPISSRLAPSLPPLPEPAAGALSSSMPAWTGQLWLPPSVPCAGDVLGRFSEVLRMLTSLVSPGRA